MFVYICFTIHLKNVCNEVYKKRNIYFTGYFFCNRF